MKQSNIGGIHSDFAYQKSIDIVDEYVRKNISNFKQILSLKFKNKKKYIRYV